MKNFKKLTKQQSDEYLKGYGEDFVYYISQHKDVVKEFEDKDLEKRLEKIKEANIFLDKLG